MKLLMATSLTRAGDLTGGYDKFIGVDKGCQALFDAGFSLDLAIGDFDSLPSELTAKIFDRAGEIIQLTPVKDDTDFEVALSTALDRFPSAEIHVTGAIGGRLDHELSALYLPLSEKFRRQAEQIHLTNMQNAVSYLLPGDHILVKRDNMRYVGFQQLDGAQITLSNAKYPLSSENNTKDIYVSNEFLPDNPMSVSFDKGAVIVIQSRDKEN